MIKIIHRRDPAGITPPTVYDVAKNTNVLQWLNNTFESQDELCGELACSFVLNQKEIFRNDHEEVDQSRLDFTLGELDQLVIVNRPAGLETGTIIAIASLVISVAATAAAFLMMSKLPGAEDARSESPNNRLNAASNEFRPGQGIPECFGAGVSYPDFIQPSYYFYENNIKKVVGLFCISAGEVIVDEVRVGDTDINDIPESSADRYPPGSKPSSRFLVIHQAATNVDGQTLIAPDDESLIKTGIQLNITEVTGPELLTTQILIVLDIDVVNDLNLLNSSFLYIRSADLNGVFDIAWIDFEWGVDEAAIFIDGSYSGAESVTGDIGRGDPDGIIGSGTAGNLDYWIGWFDTPGEEAEEVFVHWQAPTGVRKSGGGTVSLTVRIEIEDVNNPANNFAQDATITKNTFDPQFITTKFSDLPIGQYKVRARRVTNTIATDGSASEQLKVEGFVSVTPYSVANFGDATTLLVQRRATLFSPDQSGKKINLDYRRKLPYYNRITNEYETNNMQQTNSFADAAAYTLITRGNETEQSVNLAELYAINDSLIDPRLGEFTFTFNDADLSKGERVETICNVSRSVSFHDGKQWRFSRDEVKQVRSAMFNRRSVTGNNARQAWQPQRDDDADSVRIIYVDPDSNTEAYEERAFNINTGVITSGEIGNIPIEVKLAGCRNQYQATNRADLEIRRIAYQRRSVNETTYRDALELELLDRIGWVDINDVDTFDGEIMGINGSDYDTTERFIPESGKSYVVFVTDDEGYPSNTVQCTARLDTEFGFTASGISGAYVASDDQQIGSRYFIADADDLAASEFTLKSRTPSADGKVEIELVEYRPEMYENDSLQPPIYPPLIPNNLVASKTLTVGSPLSTLIIKNNGQISLEDDGFSTWYGGGIVADIGDQFEVYASVVSGALAAGPVYSWLPLTSDRAWSTFRYDTQGVGITECVLKLTIREIANPDNKEINTITIRSTIIV